MIDDRISSRYSGGSVIEEILAQKEKERAKETKRTYTKLYTLLEQMAQGSETDYVTKSREALSLLQSISTKIKM